MASITQTQAQPLSLYKRIRRKLRRIKRLTVGYIRNTRAYISYARMRHAITGPLRMARADLLRKEHQEYKAQQQQKQTKEQVVANIFLPAAIPCTKHGPQLASGFSDATQCPQCLYEQQQQAIQKLWLEHADEKHPGAFAVAVHQQQAERVPTQKVAEHRPGHLTRLHLTPLPPVDEPGCVVVTEEEMQEAFFLLDQSVKPDPDRTEVRLKRIRKIG